MMSYRLSLFILIMALLGATDASAQFVNSGVVSYERKVNLHRQYGDDIPDWVKKNVPKFQSAAFTLKFTAEHSSYTPGADNSAQTQGSWLAPGLDNAVYQDYSAGTMVASKQVYEQRFIVRDSLHYLRWRILDEVREIGGYPCRKAVTRICDSVYVVAFYAYDIPISGGPEQFGGLPGLILELAVPRLYTTWVATKVESAPVAEKDMEKISGKGKTVTRQELARELNTNLPNWQGSRSKYIWWNTL